MATPARDSATAVRAVSVIMGTVVGLTFLFGFGNVLSLALRLGVSVWVAPLVAPAVDLSILGLLVGTRRLALAGASPEVLRPARRLLIFASAVTLALNVAEPLVAGEYGKAAFDAVGPLLLIGWAEAGAGLLQAIGAASQSQSPDAVTGEVNVAGQAGEKLDNSASAHFEPSGQADGHPVMAPRPPEALLDRARQEDAAHRATYHRPISAETLRVRLQIGAGRARRLVRIVRAEGEADTPAAV
ncbi:hypothetical protein OG738_27195 [Amycolatopsis sp. NBC_01488]|uniref:hypothetical protein n=1 Tax=Amycolatopsis sp. NBC_01488 TaxID=2903563 RepID=UPI002E2B29CA|nr:hypothetical protein [Amycolatopsis sp. NBC_01488]